MTSRKTAYPAQSAKVGDAVWVLDFLVLVDNRGQWVETKITGDTRTSWLLDNYRGGYAVAKSTGKFRGHDNRPLGGVEFSREGVDARIAEADEYAKKKLAGKGK
jgi:hypothetical protein